jgi:hypothetical protein
MRFAVLMLCVAMLVVPQAYAADEALISQQHCQQLTAHTPQDNVRYRGGVDVNGKWYQQVIRGADMAEMSGVRGCMVIKPWGYGIWELHPEADLDARIKAPAIENAISRCSSPVLDRQGSRPCRWLCQGDGGRHPSPPSGARRASCIRTRRPSSKSR